MKKLLFVFACFIGVLLIGSAFAADKIVIRLVTGEVVTADVTIKTLTVQGKKGEVVITADDKTVVKMDREKKTLSDVKVGDKVTVKYAVIDSKNIARSIDIKTARTDKKGAGPAKPAKPSTKSGY